MKEYKVVIYQEGMLGSLLLGSSKVDPIKFTHFLNQNAQQGWAVITMEKISVVCCYFGSVKPTWLFWREKYEIWCL